MQERMNKLFEDVMRTPGRSDEGLAVAAWAPAVDIYETDKNEFVIKAELPEMKREAIAVTVEQHTLTISGERTPGDDVPRDAFRRVERAYGKFTRRFALPRTVDASKVAAGR